MGCDKVRVKVVRGCKIIFYRTISLLLFFERLML